MDKSWAGNDLDESSVHAAAVITDDDRALAIWNWKPLRQLRSPEELDQN